MINFFMPVNNLGYGIHSYNILKSYKKASGQDVALFPTGQIQFKDELIEECLENANNIKKDATSLMIYHEWQMTKFYGKVRIGMPVFEMEELSKKSIASLKTLDHVLVVSHWAKNVLEKYNIYSDVIPEGFDEEIFYPEYSLDYKLNKLENSINFVTVGKYETRKNSLLILFLFNELFANSKMKVKLYAHMFNPFMPNYFEEIEKNLLNVGMKKSGKNVFIRGNVEINITNLPIRNQFDLSKLYKKAHFGIFLSNAEGWNLPLCVPKGKMVLTRNGFKNIENIIAKEDIVVTHKNRFKSVIATTKRKYNNELIKIKLFNDYEYIKITPEHPLYCIKKERLNRGSKNIKNLKPEWVIAKDIKKGDLLIRSSLPIIKQNNVIDMMDFDNRLKFNNKDVWYNTGYNSDAELKKCKRFINLDKLANVFGMYIAEGSKDAHRIIFTMHEKEIEKAKEILKTIKSIFGLDGIIKEYSEIKKIDVKIYSTLLSKFFSKLCGKNAYNKKIPNYFIFGNKKSLDILIKNYVFGDGHISEGGISCCTMSELLARQLLLCTQKIGIKANVHKNKRNEYIIGWSHNNDNFRHSNKTWWIDDKNNIAILVKNINKEKYNGYVYNFEVEGDNSYLLSNITSHNCECLACGTPCLTTNSSGQSEFLKEYSKELTIENYTKQIANDGVWFHGDKGAWDFPDIQEIKNKLNNMVNNAEVLIEDNYSKYLKDNFTWDMAGEKLNKFLLT